MTAITLTEYAKTVDDPMKRAMIMMFADSSDILAALPMVTIQGNAYRYNRTASLPGIAFRGVNESYTPSSGVINPQTETLHIMGGEIDTDNSIIRQFGEGRRALDARMKIQALTADWTSKFISGDQSSEPREFDGLQVRITGSQLIHNSTASGGAVLSLAKLDEAIDQVNQPTHLIMSRATRRRFWAAMRNQNIAGNIVMTTDEFGRPQGKYNGLPFLIGYEANDNTAILPFSEAYYGGGTANGTSIYVVSMREGMFNGIQSGPIDVEDLGSLESKPAKRWRVEQDVGLAIEHKNAVARLDSIKDGDIAA